MTTDIKELVKRLRERTVLVNYGNGTFDAVPNKDCNDAADALEVLAGEVERVTKERDVSWAERKIWITGFNEQEVRAEAAEAERDRLKAALREHHNWHLNAGAIGLPDDKGGWIEIDNAAEYFDSELCSRTVTALGDAS